MTKDQLLTKISAVSLIVHDIHLFLDTHPGNAKALKDHKELSKELQNLISEYEKKYGPLMNLGHQNVDSENNWIQGPWPWQNK